MDGVLAGEKRLGNVEISRWKGAFYPREEAKTIGIGEYKDEQITENALRRQMGYDERVSH